jgi:ribonuclease R
VFSLGDVLTVQVASVKLDERKVDFELIEDPSQKKANDSRRKKYSEKDKEASKPSKKSPGASKSSKNKFPKKPKTKKSAVAKDDAKPESKKPRKRNSTRRKKPEVRPEVRPEPVVAVEPKNVVKDKLENMKKKIISFFKS